MWNKSSKNIVAILLLSSLAFTGFGNEPSATPAKGKTTRQNAKTSAQLSPQEQIRLLSQRDPRVPGISRQTVDNSVAMLRKYFVEMQPPSSVNTPVKGIQITMGNLLALANVYKQTIDHPDVEEATGNRKIWYNKIGAALVELAHPQVNMDKARDMKDEKAYQAARLEFLKKSANLEAVMKKPEKISSKELEAMKNKNFLRRKTEINQKIQELYKQRRTQG